MIKWIISGGQTGVDRAALDVAIALNIPHGGWCPASRKAEDGKIPPHYKLKETETTTYPERTRRNVKGCSGVLILSSNPMRLSGGTLFTAEMAKAFKKPAFISEPRYEDNLSYEFKNWLTKYNVTVLNIAGARESKSPGIYEKSYQFLYKLLQEIMEDRDEICK